MASVTIKEVANLAGVSVATVSKYCNGIKVRQSNGEAIEKAIAQLGFIPNEFARGLRTSKSYTVGVLLPQLDNLFFTSIISSVDRFLSAKGYSTVVCGCSSDSETERRRLDFLKRKQIDGLISVPVSSATDFAKELSGIPTVMIDRVVSGGSWSCVLSDNFSASFSAAEEFIRLNNRKIAILLGPDSNYTPLERKAGFLAACSMRGVEIPDEYILKGEYTISEGYAMTKKLLSMPSPPEALFATNNELTIGAVKAMNETGIIPGEDISFIGYDNQTIAEVSHPMITVVLQPVDMIGTTAAKTLLEMIEGRDSGSERIIHLPTELKKGGSVIDRRTGNEKDNTDYVQQ